MKLNILKSIFCGVLLTSSLISCRQEILDTLPNNLVEENTLFSTPNSISNAVSGVYGLAQMGIYNGTMAAPNSRGYIFGAAYFEQNDVRGEDVVNTQAFYQLTYESSYDPTTANNSYYWFEAYQIINRANLVAEGVAEAVSKGVISQAQGNIYIAEMKFFRAITHLELLKHFAMPYTSTSGATHLGVPYKEKAVRIPADVAASLAQGRNTVADCYTKALADLNFAEANLPTKATRIGEDKIVKATKGAAIAYKIRMFLNMKKSADVLTEFAKLAGQYSLEANPVAVFSNNYGNNESIFSMRNTADTNPGVNGALASQYNGRNLIAISPIIWNDPAWKADDKRRAESAVVTGSIFTRKYKDTKSFTDGSPVVRYAEMVLAAAEANARLDNLGPALTLLNSVRNRALATPATQAYVATDFATKTDLVNAIIKERRIEFLCEGVRWGDIHRLLNDDLAPTSGIPAKVPNGMPAATTYTPGTPYSGPLTAAIPATDRRFLWPIPQEEINVNPTLAAQQNPGW